MDKVKIEEKIFDFAYGEALNDATRRVYTGKENVAKIQKAKGIVKKYIDDVINGKNPDFYSTAFKVEKAINNDEKIKLKEYFNFGKTQKLINMTAKHFYMLCYQNDGCRKKFEYCHCPMDSIMRDKARLILKTADVPCGVLKSNTAWSKLKAENKNDKAYNEEYTKFQTTIKAFCDVVGIYPIEFDYHFWKEQSDELLKELNIIMEDDEKKKTLLNNLKVTTE